MVSGKAVVVPGTNIDTDVLYPGIYLNICLLYTSDAADE